MHRTFIGLLCMSMLAGCDIGASTSAETEIESGSLAARLSKLEAQVSYLKDRQEIHDVYLRYMRGFDRNDLELLRSAFWPDVEINYGDGKRTSSDFDDFVSQHLNRHTAELSTWAHLITNETVQIDGDVAHVETYVTALFSAKNEKSFSAHTPIVGGRYIDRLDRRDGVWRISVREFIPHFALTGTVLPLERHLPCSLGTWDKTDPSYRRPLNRRRNRDIGPECAD